MLCASVFGFPGPVSLSLCQGSPGKVQMPLIAFDTAVRPRPPFRLLLLDQEFRPSWSLQLLNPKAHPPTKTGTQ